VFTDLETTGELASDKRKMRVLLNGLIDPNLKATKAQVMKNECLRNSFHAAVSWNAKWNDNMRSVQAGQVNN
jgi:hypothetical protein